MSHDAIDSDREAEIASDERKELVERRRRNRALQMKGEILERSAACFLM